MCVIFLYDLMTENSETYIEFDNYKFNYIKICGEYYIDMKDISAFLNVSTSSVFSVIYDIPKNLKNKRCIKNGEYLHHNYLIYVISTLNYDKYMMYQDIIKKSFNFMIHDSNENDMWS